MIDNEFSIIDIGDGRSVVHFSFIEFTIYDLSYISLITSIYLFLLFLLLKLFKKELCLWSHVWIFITIAVFVRVVVPGELFFSVPISTVFSVLAKYYDNIRRPIYNIYGYNLNIENVFLFLWVIGILISLGIYLYRNIRLCRIINATPCDDESVALLKLKDELNFSFKTRLINNKAVSSPSEYGYFVHTIFVDESKYNTEQLRYIYAHELFHFSLGTHWFKLLSEILNIIFWWNPLFYLFRKLVYEWVEVYVDRFVIKSLLKADKVEYLKTIETVYRHSVKHKRVPVHYVNSMAVYNDRYLIDRFKSLAENKRYLFVNIFVLFMTVMFLYISYKYTALPEWFDENVEMKESNGFSEDACVYKEGDEYILYDNGERFRQWDPKFSPELPIIVVEEGVEK